MSETGLRRKLQIQPNNSPHVIGQRWHSSVRSTVRSKLETRRISHPTRCRVIQVLGICERVSDDPRDRSRGTISDVHVVLQRSTLDERNRNGHTRVATTRLINDDQLFVPN